MKKYNVRAKNTSVNRSVSVQSCKVPMSALSKLVRDELKAIGWSQEKLAEKAGTRASTISNLMNKSDYVPELPTLAGVARALGIPLSRLIVAAGYTIDPATPESHYLHMARLIESLPWLEHGVQKWLDLPPDEQEEVLKHIEFRMNLVAEKKQG